MTTWLLPAVRASALSKSLPTPNTHEFARVVINVAEGAPASEFADATAPIAPDPFVPLVSTFEKVTTWIVAPTACDNVAVTCALDNALGENARQISLEPACTFVRPTSAHVRPPPVTPVTLVFVPPR